MKGLMVFQKVKNFVLFRGRLKSECFPPNNINERLESYSLISVWIYLPIRFLFPHFHRSWASAVLSRLLCEIGKGFGRWGSRWLWGRSDLPSVLIWKLCLGMQSGKVIKGLDC